MPDNGPSSWLTLTDEFIGHWTDVDAALSPSTLELMGGYGLTELEADRTLLHDKMEELEGTINTWEARRMSRDTLKLTLRERFRQLSSHVRGILSGVDREGQIPNMVPFHANPGEWMKTMDDYSHLWNTINTDPPTGYTPPLTLFGGYTAALFDADVASLKTIFTEWVQAKQDTDRLRDERDSIWAGIKARLVDYREAVPGRFPSDHALVTSLPRLTPLPGHTPDPVVLEGEWNATLSRAELTWSASTDEDLDHYEVRACALEPYDAGLEFMVAIVPKETTALSTADGLGFPGASRSYKVYVVLTTDNERGSNAVTITNPGPPGPEE